MNKWIEGEVEEMFANVSLDLKEQELNNEMTRGPESSAVVSLESRAVAPLAPPGDWDGL